MNFSKKVDDYTIDVNLNKYDSTNYEDKKDSLDISVNDDNFNEYIIIKSKIR